MSELSDAFSETGWTIECDCCHATKDLAPQSRSIAEQAAGAQGWMKEILSPYGVVDQVNHYCSECVDAKKQKFVVEPGMHGSRPIDAGDIVTPRVCSRPDTSTGGFTRGRFYRVKRVDPDATSYRRMIHSIDNAGMLNWMWEESFILVGKEV